KIKGLTLNKKKLAEIPIRIPSLKDQEKIINKLDKTFERTNNYKLKIDESLINAKKLFLSVLDKEFKPKGNERSQLKKLSEISAIKGGKRVPKGYKLLDKKTQFPYIRVTDFNNNGGIDESNLKFIDETIHNQIKNYTIHSCDLFISIAGTVGKSGMVPNHLDGANLTENACKLIFEDNTHNKFIYYFTKSSFFKNQVLEKTKTASQPKLALSRLGEIVLQLPPLEDQLELTNKFIEVEKYINTLMSKKDALMFELDLLKKSVLNKEFSHVE
ncbi:MAG: restriction endonuclease subunit S, partial [Proteobacteria bacterium]|nr:restriction endonuclease subunit S [Pseudomonadota bacterium]